MSFENVVYRSFNEHLGGSSVEYFVGSVGELFWDPYTRTLRMSDGSTPGGLPLNSSTAPYKRLDTEETTNTAVCYVCLLGQSNGDGTAHMKSADDFITVPLNNVFTLTRPNTIVNNTVDDGSAWTDESTWVWSKFTSDHALYNLSRYRAGNQWENFTVELAREWQRQIDSGVNLPDLYLNHLSYSGNGFGNSAQASTRYNPIESQAGLRSNIWTGSLKTHAWSLNNLLGSNQAVIHLGVVNNQWEHDGKVINEAVAYQSWMEALLSEHDKIAGIPVPLTYWVPSTPGADDRFGAYKEAKRSLESIGGRPKINIDPKLSPLYDTSITTNPGFYGIFNDDVHYKNELFTDTFVPQFFEQNGFEGLLMTSAGGTSSSSGGGGSTDLSNYYTKSETDTIVALNTNITDWQANSYISAPTNIELPGVTYETINVPSSGWQVQRESDGKKYFRLVGRGSNYSFLSFSGLPADTSYASVVMSLKQGSRISMAASFGERDASGSSFQNNGKEFIAVAFYADTGNGQLNDATQCMMQIWSMAAGATKAAEISVPNAGLPIGSGTTGCTANIDLKFTCAPGTSGIADEYNFSVSYKLLTEVDYTPITVLENVDMGLASAAVRSGGGVGLVSGVGDAFTDAMMTSMRFKSFGIVSDE